MLKGTEIVDRAAGFAGSACCAVGAASVLRHFLILYITHMNRSSLESGRDKDCFHASWTRRQVTPS